jgi:hypothetical protein
MKRLERSAPAVYSNALLTSLQSKLILGIAILEYIIFLWIPIGDLELTIFSLVYIFMAVNIYSPKPVHWTHLEWIKVIRTSGTIIHIILGIVELYIAEDPKISFAIVSTSIILFDEFPVVVMAFSGIATTLEFILMDELNTFRILLVVFLWVLTILLLVEKYIL